MTRKKKTDPVTASEGKKEGEQMNLDMPVHAQATPPAPMPVRAETIPPLTTVMSEILKAATVKWAVESGLKEPFYVAPPELVKYRVKGWGYSVIVNELAGKQRYATARFDKDGKPTYWTTEGLGAVM